MHADVAARLMGLTAQFYDQHGLAFAHTRPRLNPGVRRVLAHIPAGARVLDVGCGDGKPGRWLARAGGSGSTYVGLDASAVLLERARALTGASAHVRFAQVDVLTPDWDGPYRAAFDWALAFALFHHVPGADRRARLLAALAGCCRAGGRLVLSCWRPSRSSRVLGRVADWAEIGLSAADVDPADRLIGWERAGQRGWRYVHELEPAEVDQLAEQTGLRLLERFAADGQAGDLADYAVYCPRDNDGGG